MRKAWEIFRREYVERVRKKSFLILTLVGPLAILALGVIPNLLLLSTPDVAKPLAIIDLSGEVGGDIAAALNPEDDWLEDGSERFPVEMIDLGGRSLAEVQEELNGRIASGSLHGYLVIEEDLYVESGIAYYSRNASNINDQDSIRDAVSSIVVHRRFLETGLDLDRKGVQRLTRRVRLNPVQLDSSGEIESEGQAAQLAKLGAAYAMLIVLYVTFLMWGVSIMRGVVEEKSSKVVEVLLSSVTSRQLMAGKILGIGAVALTQYLVWATAGIVTYYLMAARFGELLSSLSIVTVITFLGFFVLGYLLFASYFAALGAMCNSDQEAQQVQQIGMLPIIAGFLVSFYIFTNPDTTAATVMSFIPPLTPFVMLVRMNVLMPPLWEVLGSLIALMAGIAVMTLLAAKVFRVGILMTGKKPTLKELVRWLRYA